MSAPTLEKHDNGVWYIHWTDGRRSKRVSTREKDLAAAKVFLGQWLLMDREAAIAGPAAVLTCDDLWAAYERGHLIKPEKVVDPAGPARRWKTNLQGHFGHLTPAQVTQEVIDEYVEARESGTIGRPSVSATIWLELMQMWASWNWCVKRRMLPSTALPVMDELDLPPKPGSRDRWLTEAEVARLHAEAATRRVGGRLTRVERFLWLALETAARRRVIEELEWSQVDFETGVINYLKPGARQTKKRKAVVPISDRLRPVLERAYREREGQWVLDRTRPIYDALGAVCRAAGVEGCSPHVFRHTAATYMARRGVSMFHIAKVLGNTVAMVEKTYAKHAPGDLVAPVNAITGRRAA